MMRKFTQNTQPYQNNSKKIATQKQKYIKISIKTRPQHNTTPQYHKIKNPNTPSPCRPAPPARQQRPRRKTRYKSYISYH
ncbi:MAG: hypothetical protein K2L96_08720, partial [Muribaculaceae bacterium]|nr:hypothetical protein [Muribaculaceae bacterium]